MSDEDGPICQHASIHAHCSEPCIGCGHQCLDHHCCYDCDIDNPGTKARGCLHDGCGCENFGEVRGPEISSEYTIPVLRREPNTDGSISFSFGPTPTQREAEQQLWEIDQVLRGLVENNEQDLGTLRFTPSQMSWTPLQAWDFVLTRVQRDKIRKRFKEFNKLNKLNQEIIKQLRERLDRAKRGNL